MRFAGDVDELQPADVLTGAMDWLCLHLPEDKLPAAFDPRGKQAGLVVVNKGSAAAVAADLAAARGGRPAPAPVLPSFTGGKSVLPARAAGAASSKPTASGSVSDSEPVEPLDYLLFDSEVENSSADGLDRESIRTLASYGVSEADASHALRAASTLGIGTYAAEGGCPYSKVLPAGCFIQKKLADLVGAQADIETAEKCLLPLVKASPGFVDDPLAAIEQEIEMLQVRVYSLPYCSSRL